MNVQDAITRHIESIPEPKRSEMRQLHTLVLDLMPGCRLWFDDGINAEGRVVCNPTIGYGVQTLRYANGKTREFFQIGMSANTTGISINILGLTDKRYLANTFGKDLGKASVTGYCIKFKSLKDIDTDVLKAAMQYGVDETSQA